jgi:hypothetical protein
VSIKSEKTSKLEELPFVDKVIEVLRSALQRNQDQVWNRMNTLEDRINKLENKGA